MGKNIAYKGESRCGEGYRLQGNKILRRMFLKLMIAMSKIYNEIFRDYGLNI